MRPTFLAAFSGMLAIVAAGDAGATRYEYQMTVQRMVVTVSCFRGPWEDVIWDRPNPAFIDSLVNVGYTFPEAHAIAERVCRDPDTVGRPDAIVAVMSRILAENPPGN